MLDDMTPYQQRPPTDPLEFLAQLNHETRDLMKHHQDSLTYLWNDLLRQRKEPRNEQADIRYWWDNIDELNHKSQGILNKPQSRVKMDLPNTPPLVSPSQPVLYLLFR